MKKKNEIEILQMLGEIDNLLLLAPKYVHVWRYTVGIVFCLSKYYAFPIKKKLPIENESDYIRQTKHLIKQFKKDTKIDNEWLRGFYYNSAIIRLDSLYERLFKILLADNEQDKNGKCIYDMVKNNYLQLSEILKEPFEESVFKEVRNIVNSLKHKTGGAPPYIREKLELPKLALRKLLIIFNDPDIIKIINSKYPKEEVVVLNKYAPNPDKGTFAKTFKKSNRKTEIRAL